MRKVDEKRADRRHEQEMEFFELLQTQKQNAMYEESMAEKRQQHRSQFISDLDQQIKLKNVERVSERFHCKISQCLKSMEPVFVSF